MKGKKKRQEIGKMKVKKLMRYILRVQIGTKKGKEIRYSKCPVKHTNVKRIPH